MKKKNFLLLCLKKIFKQAFSGRILSIFLPATLLTLILFSSCGGSGGGSSSSSGASASGANFKNAWVWVGGSNQIDQAGIYPKALDGTGTPGARNGASAWVDKNGNFWLFGGDGYGASANYGNLNDLWKFDGKNWIWVGGSNQINQAGIDPKALDGTGTPGGRNGASVWVDKNGNFWLFGGSGYGASANYGNLNDLWKFDGKNWVWVGGSNQKDQAGIYPKALDGTGTPGGRNGASAWVDKNGNFWLFGGSGYGAVGSSSGDLNDLWKFDGKNWIWVGGSNQIDQAGIYPKALDATGTPGGRSSASAWVDKTTGNLWLFGGVGYDASSNSGKLNDLWKFDGKNWIWVGGSNQSNQAGIYPKALDGTGTPGVRNGASAGVDKNGNFWLFGGYGYSGYLNDLWKFNP